MECKLAGVMDELLATKVDPARSGVCMTFTAGALHRVVARLAAGETVELASAAPTDPVDDYDAVASVNAFCDADGGYSSQVYRVALESLQRRQRTMADLIVVIVVYYHDAAGAERRGLSVYNLA